MFTLRFMKDTEETNFSFVVSAKKYSVFEKNLSDKAVISVFDASGNSEEYVVCKSGNINEYDRCYIENMSGKTIDCIMAVFTS